MLWGLQLLTGPDKGRQGGMGKRVCGVRWTLGQLGFRSDTTTLQNNLSEPLFPKMRIKILTQIEGEGFNGKPPTGTQEELNTRNSGSNTVGLNVLLAAKGNYLWLGVSVRLCIPATGQQECWFLLGRKW